MKLLLICLFTAFAFQVVNSVPAYVNLALEESWELFKKNHNKNYETDEIELQRYIFLEVLKSVYKQYF